MTNLRKHRHKIVTEYQTAIVRGNDIPLWYDETRYHDAEDTWDHYDPHCAGALHSSCMADVPSDYFDIYAQNRNIGMFILTQFGALCARALVWKREDGLIVHDNIYANEYWRDHAMNDFARRGIRPIRANDLHNIVRITKPFHHNYPSVDTMTFICCDEKGAFLTSIMPPIRTKAFIAMDNADGFGSIHAHSHEWDGWSVDEVFEEVGDEKFVRQQLTQLLLG